MSGTPGVVGIKGDQWKGIAFVLTVGVCLLRGRQGLKTAQLKRLSSGRGGKELLSLSRDRIKFVQTLISNWKRSRTGRSIIELWKYLCETSIPTLNTGRRLKSMEWNWIPHFVGLAKLARVLKLKMAFPAAARIIILKAFRCCRPRPRLMSIMYLIRVQITCVFQIFQLWNLNVLTETRPRKQKTTIWRKNNKLHGVKTYPV